MNALLELPKANGFPTFNPDTVRQPLIYAPNRRRREDRLVPAPKKAA